MKKSKFTEAQIAFILRQGDEGTAVGEICRKAGISEAAYYNWRKKYAGLHTENEPHKPRAAGRGRRTRRLRPSAIYGESIADVKETRVLQGANLFFATRAAKVRHLLDAGSTDKRPTVELVGTSGEHWARGGGEQR
jgi:hypothetical protein